MKITKSFKRRLAIFSAAIAIATAAYLIVPEKSPEEMVKCVRNEDCELYQCANCANKDDIDADERGNEGCNPELKVSCGCVEGVCRREYR